MVDMKDFIALEVIWRRWCDAYSERILLEKMSVFIVKHFAVKLSFRRKCLTFQIQCIAQVIMLSC